MDKNRVFPQEKARHLQRWWRKYLHNPKKILTRIQPGMTVLDIGCGPGFFTTEIAKKVGEKGKVIAADLQEGMLNIIKNKVKGTKLEKRIIFHKTTKEIINLRQKVDFVLAFYLVHEVPNQKYFFREIKEILKPGGKILIVESIFRVSGKEFKETIKDANFFGFKAIARPRISLSRAALLEKPA
jgi:ubiquinone/menaquinone biosynthesis C-methylase UbiE